MITPKNRKEYERHLSMLAEKIENGTFQTSPKFRSAKYLPIVRVSPNRRINFLTVDDSVRLTANTIASMEEFNSETN